MTFIYCMDRTNYIRFKKHLLRRKKRIRCAAFTDGIRFNDREMRCSFVSSKDYSNIIAEVSKLLRITVAVFVHSWRNFAMIDWYAVVDGRKTVLEGVSYNSPAVISHYERYGDFSSVDNKRVKKLFKDSYMDDLFDI